MLNNSVCLEIFFFFEQLFDCFLEFMHSNRFGLGALGKSSFFPLLPHLTNLKQFPWALMNSISGKRIIQHIFRNTLRCNGFKIRLRNCKAILYFIKFVPRVREKAPWVKKIAFRIKYEVTNKGGRFENNVQMLDIYGILIVVENSLILCLSYMVGFIIDFKLNALRRIYIHLSFTSFFLQILIIFIGLSEFK